MKKFFVKNEWIIVLILTVLFVAFRFGGTGLPLHQDEYKWPLSVNPNIHSDVFIPHPPIGEIIYRTAGYVVGFNTNFRFVPLFFGTLNLLLLYYFLRFVYDRRVATIAGCIWIFSYFSVLASLMVDTDGEILPFFFLLSLIGYYKIRVNQSLSFSAADYVEKGNKLWWWVLLIGSCILGFLVKVSFLIVIASFAFDFLWSQKHKLSRGQILKYVGYTVLSVVTLAVILVIMKFIFPFFNLSASVSYWEHFAVGRRDWFQTFIQCIKALLYSSPLLIIVPLFGFLPPWRGEMKEKFSRLKVFLFFLVIAFIFYIVLFDFSIGALDRYLQLLILPLTVFSALVVSSLLQNTEKRKTEIFLSGSVGALILVFLQFLPHFVPPLHPKSEWIGRIVSLHWNFVYPFSGGSGPLGFYISFLFIASAWAISAGALLLSKIFSKINPRFPVLALIFIIPIAFVYNFVFIEEYLVGRWNGYAPRLLAHAVEFIANNPDIQKVTVYNDNGGNEIQAVGKYRKRLYVDPKFDFNEKIKSLNMYKEHYFVLDVPRLDPTSVYVKFFDSCKIVYKEVDKKMSAIVYDCRNAPDLK